MHFLQALFILLSLFSIPVCSTAGSPSKRAAFTLANTSLPPSPSALPGGFQFSGTTSSAQVRWPSRRATYRRRLRQLAAAKRAKEDADILRGNRFGDRGSGFTSSSSSTSSTSSVSSQETSDTLSSSSSSSSSRSRSSSPTSASRMDTGLDPTQRRTQPSRVSSSSDEAVGAEDALGEQFKGLSVSQESQKALKPRRRQRRKKKGASHSAKQDLPELPSEDAVRAMEPSAFAELWGQHPKQQGQLLQLRFASDIEYLAASDLFNREQFNPTKHLPGSQVLQRKRRPKKQSAKTRRGGRRQRPASKDKPFRLTRQQREEAEKRLLEAQKMFEVQAAHQKKMDEMKQVLADARAIEESQLPQRKRAAKRRARRQKEAAKKREQRRLEDERKRLAEEQASAEAAKAEAKAKRIAAQKEAEAKAKAKAEKQALEQKQIATAQQPKPTPRRRRTRRGGRRGGRRVGALTVAQGSTSTVAASQMRRSAPELRQAGYVELPGYGLVPATQTHEGVEFFNPHTSSYERLPQGSYGVGPMAYPSPPVAAQSVPALSPPPSSQPPSSPPSPLPSTSQAATPLPTPVPASPSPPVRRTAVPGAEPRIENKEIFPLSGSRLFRIYKPRPGTP